MKSLLDKAFRYTRACDTDAAYLRKKFKRIQDERDAARVALQQKVTTIKPHVKGKL